MAELEQLEACRICVNCFPLTEMDFINIFQPNEEFQQELDFIQGEIRQWQLKIQVDDGLPQRICANCFAKFCSIEAFRKECEAAQEKLLQTLMQQSSSNEPEVQNVIKNLETPLPLVGNYDSGSVVLDTANNVLVSSVNLTQSDVSLNDFPVFDQQFAHFDNPALMDASSTLLDGNLIAADTSQELGFLPSQNLFTFETAESPTTGTLPLVETETTSIMNDILQVKPEEDGDGGGGAGGSLGSGVGEIIIKQDLEDMLQRSIIPTNTKLTQQRGTGGEGGGLGGGEQKSNNANVVAIKMELPEVKKETGNQYLNNNYTIRGRNDYQNTTITFINREDTNSDMECDDSDMNARLKGLSYACHYCFCPETGPIEHLVFPNEDALSQHFFDIHDPNRPYTCPKCPQSYKTQLLRDNHVRLIHKITEIQTCNYCKKRLKGSTDVHQYNCQYVGDWECQNCKEKFPQTPLYRFRLHQRQHERIKQFKCRLCERTFMKKANMEAHQRMHKAEVQSAYSCNICKASFVDDYELKRHKYQQHSAEAPLKCKFCHKGFSSTVFLQRHMNQFHPDNAKNQHNNNNNNNNNNNACSSSASSSSASSSALNSPTEQHTCLNCNMGFKTSLKLQNHLVLGRDKNGNCLSNACNKQERRKIQRQGVYPCFHCPRRFHLRSQLDKHLNTHDARLRPFQCEQCVTRCRTSCELKQHVNVAHLNIKAFSCDKCGKSFGYKKDLRDHMLFHAEINVHCTEEGCDYVCKNEKALNDHIRHKHRLLSCEYCHEQFTRQKLTAHLRKIHRAEIDVELAGESDNYYKSQLLNNNNDITQISFNLLNTQQQQQQQQPLNQQQTQLTNNSQQLPPSSSSQCLNSVISSSSSVLTTSSTLSPSTITASSSSSSSVALTSCLTPTNTNTTKQGTNLNTNTTTSISTHNLLNDDVDHHHHHDQLCAMFATDPHDTNTPTLALNGLVTSEHDDLNLVSNDDVVGDDATNMFLVPTSASATNDNQLDQYFMASLIDTEQEIIVT